jgi:hypothetical protein
MRHNADVHEHHGNGEAPQSLERRRQLLVWRWLAVLAVFGGLVGLIRLAVDLGSDAPTRSLVYQVVLLLLNGLVGLFAIARLRQLRRR